MKPPWPMPWPLVIARVTTIDSDASPGPTRSRRMPSSCAAVSSAHSASADFLAISCGVMPGLLRPEVRRALLQEGRNALDVLVRLAGLPLKVALEIELRVEAVGRRGGEGALHQPERVRRPGREPGRDLVRLAHELVVVDGALDHAPGLRLLGADRVGEHHQRAGARLADEARQEPGAAGIRDEADPGEGLQEPRRSRRQHDVAGEREVGAGAGRDAVDRADDRLRQFAQGADQRIVALLDRLAEIGRRRRARSRGRRGPARRRSPCRPRSGARRGPDRPLRRGGPRPRAPRASRH